MKVGNVVDHSSSIRTIIIYKKSELDRAIRIQRRRHPRKATKSTLQPVWFRQALKKSAVQVFPLGALLVAGDPRRTP
jgi:hypothetical protein